MIDSLVVSNKFKILQQILAEFLTIEVSVIFIIYFNKRFVSMTEDFYLV